MNKKLIVLIAVVTVLGAAVMGYRWLAATEEVSVSEGLSSAEQYITDGDFSNAMETLSSIQEHLVAESEQEQWLKLYRDILQEEVSITWKAVYDSDNNRTACNVKLDKYYNKEITKQELATALNDTAEYHEQLAETLANTTFAVTMAEDYKNAAISYFTFCQEWYAAYEQYVLDSSDEKQQVVLDAKAKTEEATVQLDQQFNLVLKELGEE